MQTYCRHNEHHQNLISSQEMKGKVNVFFILFYSTTINVNWYQGFFYLLKFNHPLLRELKTHLRDVFTCFNGARCKWSKVKTMHISLVLSPKQRMSVREVSMSILPCVFDTCFAAFLTLFLLTKPQLPIPLRLAWGRGI